MAYKRSSYETRIGTMDAVEGRHLSYDRLQTEDGLVASIVKRENEDVYKGALTKKYLTISEEDFEIVQSISSTLGLEISRGDYATEIIPDGLEKQIDDNTSIAIEGLSPDSLADKIGYSMTAGLGGIATGLVIAAPEVVTATTAGLSIVYLLVDGASYALSINLNENRIPLNKVPRSPSHAIGYFSTKLANLLSDRYSQPDLERLANVTDVLENKEKQLRNLREEIDAGKSPMNLGDSWRARRLNSSIRRANNKLDKLVSLDGNALVVTYNSEEKESVINFMENVALGEELGHKPSKPKRRKKTKVA